VILNINIPLRVRLQNRRDTSTGRIVAGSALNTVGAGTHNAWRNYSGHNSPDIGHDKDGHALAWFDSEEKIGRAGWRFAGYADKIARIDHTGWFTDEYQDNTLRGAVVQLPARAGRCVFLAGYVDTFGGSFRFSTADVFIGDEGEAKREAAYWADQLAEHAAEDEREYNIKESANTRAEELAERNKEILSDVLALWAERDSVFACGHALAVAELETRCRGLIEEHKDNAKTIEELQDNPYSIVS
jgi:hypothetical protein